MNSLIDLAHSHQKRVSDAFKEKEKAQLLFFRVMGPKLQQNLHRMMSLDEVPQVFMHGNPHIDNYARTLTGAGMLDFDRSRLGPYAWDVIRFLGSLALRLQDADRGGKFLPKKTIDAFAAGYIGSLNDPDLHYSIPHFLVAVHPKKEELSTKEYISSGIKWAKKMKKMPISPQDKRITELLALYLKSRSDEKLMDLYRIASAGQSPGSLGKMHYIIALEPKDSKSGRDHILLDIKECYSDANDGNFKSPFDHDGLRMIKASNLYAPGVEQRLGHLTYEGRPYWGRQIPPFKAKVANTLTLSEALDLAFCVGQQLGRGHRRSSKEMEPSRVEAHFRTHLDRMLKVSEYINKELELGLEFLMRSKALREQFELPEAWA